MRSLSGLGIGLSLLFGFLFLALVAEVYYLLWWKKRMIASSRSTDEEYNTSAREFLNLFCWKKSSPLAPAPFAHRELCTSVRIVDGSEGGQLSLDPNACKNSSFKPLVGGGGGGGGGGGEGLDAELMRLHNLSGPPRILFTIKEETKEDLESEDGRPRRRTLSDLLLVAESPFLTPFSSPPLFPPPHLPPHAPHLPSYDKHGFNPLFESHLEDEKKWVWPSPPPKFKFLRDAEEKLYRKTLVEEALKVHSFGVTNQSNLANISPPEISNSVVKGGTLTTISPSVLGAQRNDVLIECPC